MSHVFCDRPASRSQRLAEETFSGCGRGQPPTVVGGGCARGKDGSFALVHQLPHRLAVFLSCRERQDGTGDGCGGGATVEKKRGRSLLPRWGGGGGGRSRRGLRRLSHHGAYH